MAPSATVQGNDGAALDSTDLTPDSVADSTDVTIGVDAGPAGDSAVPDAADVGPDAGTDAAGEETADTGDAPILPEVDAADDAAEDDADTHDGADTPDGADATADIPGCSADACPAGGTCWPAGTTHPEQACEVCGVAAGGSAAWVAAPDGATCTDGSACTAGDGCAAGACKPGLALACEDGNPCTLHSCDPQQGCVSAGSADAAACSDGDACTGSDHCQAGNCLGGSPVSCDDGKPCTADGCAPKSGCTATELPASVSCTDGDACTGGDHCQGGGCAGGPTTPCDDGKPCTLDGCDPNAGCVATNLAAGASCTDGDACTGSDHCQDGSCAGGPTVACNDGNPCTLDGCDPKAGCMLAAAPTTTQCSDGDKCTTGDVCAAGKCGGKPVICDDDNACTLDACDVGLGCTWTPVAGACDDANPCTANDGCFDGLCQGLSKDCYAGIAIPACVKATCANDGACSYIPTNLGACRPDIEVSSPARGAFLVQEQASVTVTGKAAGTIGKLATVTVNGIAAIPAADGSFSALVPLQFGNNSLVVVAKDQYGSVGRHVQALQWSTAWAAPDQPLAPAGGLWLGKKALDSGVHDHTKPRDLATVFEIAASKLDLAAALPVPLYQSGLGTATLLSASHDPPVVNLLPQAGYLQLTMTVPSVIIKADAVAKACLPFFGCQTVTGVVTAAVASVVTQAKLTPKVVAGKAVFTVSDVTSKATGVVVTADNPTLMLAAGDMQSVLTTQLETGATQAVTDVVPTLSQGVGEGLSAMGLSTNLSIPKPAGSGVTDIAVTGGLLDMQTTSGGLAMGMQLAAVAIPVIAIQSPGVPLRQGCGPAPPNFGLAGAEDMEFAVWDDLLNGALRALWLAGWFEEDLGQMFTGTPLEQLGITAKSSALLPPLVADCPGPGASMYLSELKLSLKGVHLGQPLTAVVHANIKAQVTAKWADGQIQLWLGQAEAIDVQCEMDALKNSSNAEDMEKYMTIMYLPALLEKMAAKPLLALPAPVLDFSASIGLPKGQAVLAIDAKQAEHKTGVSRAAGPVKP